MAVPEPSPYRDLPSVDELADQVVSRLPRPVLVDVARSALQRARETIAGGGDHPDVHADVGQAVRALERASGVQVVNATGVLLHTNLGRARWSEEAVERAARAAAGFSNVEIDLETGGRSRRGGYVTTLLRSLTGAEDALIVNNNASALLLALAATSAGLSVPVSRGELIEIGGSYRLPSVMEASGARLVEVGTTNRTRLGDYETALQLHSCGSILKVHPSNYRVEGFTEAPSLSQLASLARDHAIPLIHDIGSGLLDSETPWIAGPTPLWLRGEPAARQSLADGADLVTFSGDKLLGGPQAGVIVGRGEVVSELRGHPLARALRVDGSTLAALAATLEAYSDREITRLPFWRQALLDPDEIRGRAEAMASRLDAETAPGESAVGAGSVPGLSIPTTLVVLRDEDHLHGCLLTADPPVLCRREEGSLVVDLRTVDPELDGFVVEAIDRCR